MAFARSAGKVFFPLDEELALLPGMLTPHGHETLVRLSSWMPFAKATQILADVMGIHVSKSLGQRYTEAAGAAYEEIQNEAVEKIEREMPPEEASAERMQISADGAMVPLLHGVWAEVRTLVVGEISPVNERREEERVHARNLSYFSRKVSAEEFQRLALVELYKRGVGKAKEVAAVMDGASWEQGFIDYHCPNAVRILDFPHAAEHINQVGEFVHGEKSESSRAWLKERLHALKHEGPQQLLAEIQEYQKEYPQAEVITSNLAYLEKREAQMQYPSFRAQGWPIGSGIVESGNKLVVEARLKGAGMHWAGKNVNPMLSLRNIICSDRWQEEWPKIELQLRRQNRERKKHLSHPQNPLPATAETVIRPTLDEKFLQTLAASIQESELPPKPKRNPWRNFKHGKALYQPSPPPKK
jgi:hypothetical protein